MLNDFSWNMTGYIPKYPVDSFGADIGPYVAERIFQLEPEPPTVNSLNEYILSALLEKNLMSSCTIMSRNSTSAPRAFLAWIAAICTTQTDL